MDQEHTRSGGELGERLGCQKGGGFGKCTKSGDVLGERLGCVKRVVLEGDKTSPGVAMYQESNRAVYQERALGSAHCDACSRKLCILCTEL